MLNDSNGAGAGVAGKYVKLAQVEDLEDRDGDEREFRFKTGGGGKGGGDVESLASIEMASTSRSPLQTYRGERSSSSGGVSRNDELLNGAQRKDCHSICCSVSSNFKELYTTSDNATIPLVCRCAGQRPFIPQSYNYTDFEKNQVRAIGQRSLRLTLEVVQQVFAQVYFKGSVEEKALVTNLKVIENCRFFPIFKGLNQEESVISAERDVSLPGPLLDSVVGCFVQDTFTVTGQEFMCVRSSNPTKNINTILNRQACIRLLKDNDALRSDIEDALAIYGEFENEFCSRLTPDATKLPGRIENYLKFALLDFPESVGRNVNAYIRESIFLLSVNNYIKTLQDSFNVLLLVVLAVALLEYTISLLFPLVFASQAKRAVDAFVSRYIGQTGAMISALQSVDNKGTKLLAALLGALCAGAKAPDNFGYFKADMAVKSALQAKMVSVAKCIRSMERVYTLISSNPELENRLEQFGKLRSLISNDDPKVKKMLMAIQSSTLDAPSKYFNFGPVIVSWNLLLDKDVRKLVLQSLVAMGEIDTNVTLANKIITSSPLQPFTLPRIIDSVEAIFEVKNAHFPPVTRNSSNFSHENGSISLPPLSILTAENGAGKTTFALAWMNILLSTQSLGIAACAEGSKVSIFDSIMTSMGVSDSNQESSHESHERFDNELLAKLENHSEDKVFVLLDELYRGTHEEKGARKLSELAAKLSSQSKRLKAVFITHFKSFATDLSIDAIRYTTKKNRQMKPSGILQEGSYDFPSVQ